MITSDGRGIQADSTAISMTIPPYPSVEIVAIMNPERIDRIFEIIDGIRYSVHSAHIESLQDSKPMIVEPEGENWKPETYETPIPTGGSQRPECSEGISWLSPSESGELEGW